jgi:S-methylmethionine-dependent homocysteine/selenocysteine methylase
MNAQESLRERLGAGPPLLLDAAMGTELEKRGAPSGLPLWSARALSEAPELVLAIHRGEVAAGAQALTANTFRTHARTLAREGKADRAVELTAIAVRLARDAASHAAPPPYVLGSLAPLEDCYRPDLAPGLEALVREHELQARALAEAGVDGILLETHNSVAELQAAARAARSTGLPVIASMVTDGKGRLLSGEPIEKAVDALGEVFPDALSINCVPARDLAADLARLARAAPGVPLGAYGNLGPPTEPGGTRFERDIPPEEYADIARGWLDLGARLVGGCCGTTAAHTAAMRRMLDARRV